MYLLQYEYRPRDTFEIGDQGWWWYLYYNTFKECVAQSGKGYAHKRSAQAAFKRIMSTSVLNKTKEVK